MIPFRQVTKFGASSSNIHVKEDQHLFYYGYYDNYIHHYHVSEIDKFEKITELELLDRFKL